jgi:ElaB/YqjD/DUF883 family membrane-anchored ribosome-binding protein
MIDTTATQQGKLMSDLRAGISDAEDVLRMTADQVGESAVDLRSRMQARLIQSKTDLLHLQDAALAKARAAGHATGEFVHENPWKSIGIGAGIALVVGLQITRR